MLKIFSLLFLSLVSYISSGQSGTWTWINGDSAYNSPGVYGTQGVPSVNNHPPGLYEACEWKDKTGNFWIYGGVTDSSNTTVEKSDLWKYNPSTNEWTWVKGNGLGSQPAIYGTIGDSAQANSPGMRGYGVASWVDTSGNLWLFGGETGAFLCRNDLWKYDINTNCWTWINGSNVGNAPGVYGAYQVPSSNNTPGARYETSSQWTDSLNNLWLFGGADPEINPLMDMWKYNIGTNEWTWMAGTSTLNGASHYGVKGLASNLNLIGGRFSYDKWKDTQGDLWIMGGFDGSATLNDVWKYDVRKNEQTWMYGPNVSGDSGKYKNTCLFDTIDMPASRFEHRSAVTDNCGRFWLFGGSSTLQWGGDMNDLWIFDPIKLEWEWLNGSSTLFQSGSYGIMGLPSPSNISPPRSGALAWWGNDNKFYLFGGANGNNGFVQFLSDMWVFSPDTNCVPVCNSVILSTDDKTQDDKILIYPNPATGKITLTVLSSYFSEQTRVFITNVLGQVLYQSALTNSQYTIDVSTFTSGVYFVDIVCNKRRLIGKFIKQ